MKTILVLTDLSKKAENAAFYAMKMAENMQANLILYHSFIVFQSVAVPETGMWPVDDYETVKAESLANLEKLAALLKQHHRPGKFDPAIEVISDTGNLATKVNKIAQDRRIDMVVMGSKSDDVISHLFFGSETNDVLDEVHCPVLFVPEKCSYRPVKTIVFSTDLKKAYPKAVGFLVEVAKTDDADIVVAHIGDAGNFSEEQCLTLIKEVFEYPKASFKQIPGENHISDKLTGLIDLLKPDLIVMIHHQHTVFGNIIPGSNSKKMLYHHQSPLLVLPD